MNLLDFNSQVKGYANRLVNLVEEDNKYLYKAVLAEFEKPFLEVVMDKTKGNQSKAAKVLGINRGTLRSKLRKYNIGE